MLSSLKEKKDVSNFFLNIYIYIYIYIYIEREREGGGHHKEQRYRGTQKIES